MAVADADWRKSSLNVFIMGFPAPRGVYKLSVVTSSWKEDRRDAVSAGGGSKIAGGGVAGQGGGGAKEEGRQMQLEEVEDLWVLSYVLAPPDVSRFLVCVGTWNGAGNGAENGARNGAERRPRILVHRFFALEKVFAFTCCFGPFVISRLSCLSSLSLYYTEYSVVFSHPPWYGSWTILPSASISDGDL